MAAKSHPSSAHAAARSDAGVPPAAPAPLRSRAHSLPALAASAFSAALPPPPPPPPPRASHPSPRPSPQRRTPAIAGPRSRHPCLESPRPSLGGPCLSRASLPPARAAEHKHTYTHTHTHTHTARRIPPRLSAERPRTRPKTRRRGRTERPARWGPWVPARPPAVRANARRGAPRAGRGREPDAALPRREHAAPRAARGQGRRPRACRGGAGRALRLRGRPLARPPLGIS